MRVDQLFGFYLSRSGILKFYAAVACEKQYIHVNGSPPPFVYWFSLLMHLTWKGR